MPGATRCPAVASSPPPTPTEIARIHTSEVSELNRVRLSLLGVALLTAVSSCTFGGSAATTTPTPWLGAWRNASCAWEHDDAWIRSHVAPIASSPAVLAYFLGDEPLASKCPKAPAMFKARTALVHQIDPVHPTFTVISASDAGVT